MNDYSEATACLSKDFKELNDALNDKKWVAVQIEAIDLLAKINSIYDFAQKKLDAINKNENT